MEDNKSKLNKIYIIIATVIILIIMAALLYYIKTSTKQYLVQLGTIEKTEVVTGLVIKNEKTIDKDQSKVIVPVISENSRVSKGEIIATYKGEEYTNYEETLRDMDKEILELMKDIPEVYSSEINTIESYIYTLVKSSEEETSFNKMQEYKQKINSYINKKANIISKMSPTGAKVKTLIDKRNAYEAKAKKSNDNVIAPMGGIVMYSADGLENKLSSKKIDYLKFDNVLKIIKENKTKDSTKIKVVNNYEAYIIVRADINNMGYMLEGVKYTLRLIENSNSEIEAELYKIVKNEDTADVYFKVTNKIEDLVNVRDTEFEVVWNSYEGLLVPNEAIVEEGNISYINIIRYSDYEKVPVKVRIKNDGYSIVKNYDEEELEELNIKSEYDL